MTPPSLTGIVLTLNEERNLPACLESMRACCGEIFVVDSGSTDGTQAVSERFGARFVKHAFEGHAKQWNWALTSLPITGDWVLALDADQRMSPGLQDEIRRTLHAAPAEVQGYYLPRMNVFRGRQLRHGGYWPKRLLKLFRRGSARCDERELLDFRFYVTGKKIMLRQTLIEENLKEENISFWLLKHIRFIELRAKEEQLRRSKGCEWLVRPRFWGTPDERTLWLKGLWYRMPPRIRPFLYFSYRYLLRLGFLDGWEGTLYIFLHSFWYECMVAVRLEEIERERVKK